MSLRHWLSQAFLYFRAMEDYIISVDKVEELQTINDIQSLDTIMDRARRVIIGGGVAILERRGIKFDQIDNEETFKQYREKVYRYLK